MLELEVFGICVSLSCFYLSFRPRSKAYLGKCSKSNPSTASPIPYVSLAGLRTVHPLGWQCLGAEKEGGGWSGGGGGSSITDESH